MLAELFPGGFLEFAQFADQVPEDALEDIIIRLQERIEPQDEGGMPGDFGDGGIDVGGAERRDPVEHGGGREDEDHETLPQQGLLRGLRSVLGRFWGRDEESTPGDEAPVDDTVD